MKDTFYFSHDYNSSQDEKMRKLIRKEEMEGYGVYWRIIEMLYQETDVYKLEKDYEGIAFDLRVDCERIKRIIENYQLFEFDDGFFWSNSVLERVNKRLEKSQKARESANARWKNRSAMQTQCDSNAIKERKGKEIKGKDIKESIKEKTPKERMEEFKKANEEKNEFYDSIITLLANKYMITKEQATLELEKFYLYWTEKTKSGKKELWETKKTFEVDRRLYNWFNNADKFSNKKEKEFII